MKRKVTYVDSDSTTASNRRDSRDEVDLHKMFAVLWSARIWIIGFAATVSIATTCVVLSLPNIYESEVLLAPVQANADVIGGLANKYGGLASLAGITLPSSNSIDKSELGIEILQTRDFLTKFIDKHDLLVPLMAVRGWDELSNQLIFEQDIYDRESQEWIRKVQPPKKPKPSSQEAVDRFREWLSVSRIDGSVFIKIEMKHYSPYLAKQWLEWLVEDIDSEIRGKDITDAERSIAYLNDQITRTNIAEIRAMLAEIVQRNVETLMLAQIRETYLFEVIDNPIVPETKAGPNRIVVVLFSFLISSLLSMALIIIKNISESAN